MLSTVLLLTGLCQSLDLGSHDKLVSVTILSGPIKESRNEKSEKGKRHVKLKSPGQAWARLSALQSELSEKGVRPLPVCSIRWADE